MPRDPVSVLASAVRFADRALDDHKAFRRARLA